MSLVIVLSGKRPFYGVDVKELRSFLKDFTGVKAYIPYTSYDIPFKEKLRELLGCISKEEVDFVFGLQ